MLVITNYSIDTTRNVDYQSENFELSSIAARIVSRIDPQTRCWLGINLGKVQLYRSFLLSRTDSNVS